MIFGDYFKMELAFIICCVYPVLVSSITVSSNGNSPRIRMVGGMMVDAETKIDTDAQATVNTEVRKKTNYEKSRKLNFNATKLSANERYRRLIPYMTFYYANDLPVSTTEDNVIRNVEVEKAQIIESATIERQPKKVYHSSYRNIPRFQGNRIPQYISSSDHTKLYPTYQDPYIFEKTPAEQLFERVPHKYLLKTQLFAPSPKPQYDIYDENVRYYIADKEQPRQVYKLVPYQQTPPVQVTHQNNDYNPVMARPPPVKDTVYLQPRPARPQYAYNTQLIQQTARKPASVVTEHYYEKLQPEPHKLVPPVIEGGFKPITRPTESPLYTTVAPIEDNVEEQVQIVESTPTVDPLEYEQPKYYQYVVEKPVHKPEVTNSVTLNDLISSLRINKPVAKPTVKPNMGSSIRTLLQVLNVLRVMPHQNEVEPPVLSTPKPFVNPNVVIASIKPEAGEPEPIRDDVEFHQEPYLAGVNPPSQHIDEYRISSDGSSSQEFPLKIHSDDDGGTPGRPGADYPILTTIPQTAFDCKTQRYKGFFADPETRCQVWHYCDLNGGQASFLCPNGTIFSQAGLTCDWWFNVRCASTTQLYVLNESLYKYILPHSPKFPEDYSGPLVDKYLTLKFKEMEEQFRKKKNKQSSEDKEDDHSEEAEESTTSSEDSSETLDGVSESSVVIESPGTSGNLQRTQE